MVTICLHLFSLTIILWCRGNNDTNTVLTVTAAGYPDSRQIICRVGGTKFGGGFSLHDALEKMICVGSPMGMLAIRIWGLLKKWLVDFNSSSSAFQMRKLLWSELFFLGDEGTAIWEWFSHHRLRERSTRSVRYNSPVFCFQVGWPLVMWD